MRQLYYELRQLLVLRIATNVITNCDSIFYYELRQRYYELRQVLRIATTLLRTATGYYELRQLLRSATVHLFVTSVR